MSEELVKLSGVQKAYRRGKQSVPIFETLDMSIEKGAFLAIMGPSGSGKTTLLNLLGGVDRPTGGSITFQGQRVDNLSESRLAAFRAGHVGFIFQFYNLMPMLTAAQNVELPLLLTSQGSKARKERAATALQIVGLSDRAAHKPSELSGGQQQRVAIARAIVSDPELILADEPTGDLDRETANEILSMLQELNANYGKTIVMVTHDAEAARYARKTLHLDKGHFVEKDLVA
ncbi:MAG: ABC transporter ATP-binding protein [Alphaproteobacteria bacterium]|nr:ABC transporter ATP-binding protein [Alphaproteobacteria bacterium]